MDGHDFRLQEEAVETRKWSNNGMMSITCDKTKECWWPPLGAELPPSPGNTIQGKMTERATTTKLLGDTFFKGSS